MIVTQQSNWDVDPHVTDNNRNTKYSLQIFWIHFYEYLHNCLSNINVLFILQFMFIYKE